MWTYEKRLQYPVNIKKPDAKMAMVIITQFGGPDGELAASQRYLSQRYSMPYRNVAGVLTDIGTEASEMFLRPGAVSRINPIRFPPWHLHLPSTTTADCSSLSVEARQFPAPPCDPGSYAKSQAF